MGATDSLLPSTVRTHRVQKQPPVAYVFSRQATSAPPSTRTRSRTRIRVDGCIVSDRAVTLQAFTEGIFRWRVSGGGEHHGGRRGGRSQGRDLGTEAVAIQDQQEED